MTTIPIPLPPGTTPVTDKWQVNGDDVLRLSAGPPTGSETGGRVSLKAK